MLILVHNNLLLFENWNLSLTFDNFPIFLLTIDKIDGNSPNGFLDDHLRSRREKSNRLRSPHWYSGLTLVEGFYWFAVGDWKGSHGFSEGLVFGLGFGDKGEILLLGGGPGSLRGGEMGWCLMIPHKIIII